MPIDPNEAPEGYVAVEETDTPHGCDGCAFNSLYCANTHPCIGAFREDGCDVIFVKENNDAD